MQSQEQPRYRLLLFLTRNFRTANAFYANFLAKVA